jgi:glycosyltransferase involved in cell wall biosynthesis
VTVARLDLGWTFLAPSGARPTGGDIARFELANAVARRGEASIRVVHLPTPQLAARTPADLPWFTFEPTVEHQFPVAWDPEGLPPADVVVYSPNLLSTALGPDGVAAGRPLVEALQGAGRDWLPVLLLQGHGVFQPAVEDLALQMPGPKVCVGSWLVDVAVRAGVRRADAVHIPNGIDPDRFHVRRAIDGRSPRVAMNYDPHPAKQGREGLAAVGLLRRRQAVPATIFGTLPIPPSADPDLEVLPSPSQETLATTVYSETSVFLQPGRREGFGMCAVEAMASGCALVTVSNGGSDDYAFDGETAIVCGAEPAQMAEAMARLIGDEPLRVRLATAGARFVERFRWTTSADRLVHLASERVAGHGPLPRVDLDATVRALGR